MNGKLVILAGGASSRMKSSEAQNREIDKELLVDAELKAKAMIRLGENGRPFLDYLISNAVQAGYDDLVIVIGEKDNSIKQYYSSDESGFTNIKISFAVQPVPEGRMKPMGTADALFHALKAKPDWSGFSFTVVNSDNLYSVRALKLMRDSEFRNAMIDYDRNGLKSGRERIGRYAITQKDPYGYLTKIVEKPTEEIINSLKEADGFVGVSMNIFKFDYDMILPVLEIVPINPEREEKELPTAVQILIGKFPGSLYTIPLSEDVPDLTSKEDILTVKKYLADIKLRQSESHE